MRTTNSDEVSSGGWVHDAGSMRRGQPSVVVAESSDSLDLANARDFCRKASGQEPVDGGLECDLRLGFRGGKWHVGSVSEFGVRVSTSSNSLSISAQQPASHGFP